MFNPTMSILNEQPRRGGPLRPFDPTHSLERVKMSLPSAKLLRRRALIRLALIVLLLAVMALQFSAPLVGLLFVAAVLTVMIILSAWNRSVGKTLMQATGRAEELVTLTRYAEAWDLAWDNLPVCRTHPLGVESWLRLVLTMARSAIWSRQFETAEVLLEFTLEQIGNNHPLAPYCHVQRSVAAGMDKCPGIAEDELLAVRSNLIHSRQPLAEAALLVAELSQCYASNQPQRALEHAKYLIKTLAPLGREGSLGHLLAAWAYNETGDIPKAKNSWRDAILLNGYSACCWMLDLGFGDIADLGVSEFNSGDSQ